MPAERSRRLIARPSPYTDQTTGSNQSEDPVPRVPPAQLWTPRPQQQLLTPRPQQQLLTPRPQQQLLTPLPQQQLISSLPAPTPLPHPTPLLQPTIPTSASPMRLSESLNPLPPDPEALNSPPPTPSSAIVPAIPSSTQQHFHAHEIFHKAQNVTISNSQFIDVSPADSGIGLKRLLKHSMPDAFYNSSARYPPPKCHLGTRNDYIALITSWAQGQSDRQEPILWMRGPFGIGKSAVAQSCAEALAPLDKLAATLFFSRSNGDRDDPRRVFTSIAYQIAVKWPPFREIVNRRMMDDPALATMSLSTQFEHLLVHPLRSVNIPQSGLDGRVVIIDGLDECRGTAEQCEIIRVIAASVHKRTTPFRWFITSRPEDPIIRTMNSIFVFPVLSRIELPVSRAIDHEILLFLTHEFKKIREDYGLAETWPSEDALALLVERGAGLWIYVATMIRFIKDENSFGPKDQLRIVLEFAKEVSPKVGPDNPLAEMDFFYTLILQRVPSKVRTTVRRILLLDSASTFGIYGIAGALSLSIEQLRRACASIRSVMKVEHSISYYHTSFLDFMRDPQRSKKLCIMGDFLIGWRQELLRWLHEVCSRSTGAMSLADSSHIVFPSSTIIPEGLSYGEHYRGVLWVFWGLCSAPEHPLDLGTATSLAKIPFRQMLTLVGNGYWDGIAARRVRNNLPVELRDKVVRKGSECPAQRDEPFFQDGHHFDIIPTFNLVTAIRINWPPKHLLPPLPQLSPIPSRCKCAHPLDTLNQSLSTPRIPRSVSSLRDSAAGRGKPKRRAEGRSGVETVNSCVDAEQVSFTRTIPKCESRTGPSNLMEREVRREYRQIHPRPSSSPVINDLFHAVLLHFLLLFIPPPTAEVLVKDLEALKSGNAA
ncbi:hypothetical protein D9756_005176 [Leucocoprinus leucothites]|uniref:Nephrocystin 3-like N-terminal domain-containing protein n=1 Tax=Leucocoprinus leucothites TaxID=201217 RepID=A0A8H5GA95_9AGAR|nr:hypothetical protein D9756_005176 [Leucoagaricus leucothites]